MKDNRERNYFSLRVCSYGSELARLGGLAHLIEIIFYPTFIWNLLSQYNQKVCYVARQRLFDQVVFTITNGVKPIMQNKCSYII